MVYPDHHAHEWDFGTEGQQEVTRRYRRFAARVSFWRQCGRVAVRPGARVFIPTGAAQTPNPALHLTAVKCRIR